MVAEAYLWFHLGGLAALPLTLALTLVGLGLGTPGPWVWLEFGLVGLVAIAPVVLMQWRRPFYIFSVLGVAVPPKTLNDHRRRLLTRYYEAPRSLISGGVGLAMVPLLWQLFRLAPLTRIAISPDLLPQWRLLGLVVAALGLTLTHFLLQIAIALIPVGFTPESTLQREEPYPFQAIPQDFLILGFPLGELFPSWSSDRPEPISDSQVVKH